MSLTPTGGIMPGTRSGDLDPEIPLLLLERPDASADTVRDLLDRHCGLAGIAHELHDVRDLLAARDHDPAADLALRYALLPRARDRLVDVHHRRDAGRPRPRRLDLRVLQGPARHLSTPVPSAIGPLRGCGTGAAFLGTAFGRLHWCRVRRPPCAVLELTHLQFVLLASTWWLTQVACETPSQRRLAEHADTDPMMTSQVLRTLEAKGFVVRDPDPADSWTRRIGVTRRGATLARRAIAVVEATDADFFRAAGDMKALLDVLRAWVAEPSGAIKAQPHPALRANQELPDQGSGTKKLFLENEGLHAATTAPGGGCSLRMGSPHTGHTHPVTSSATMSVRLTMPTSVPRTPPPPDESADPPVGVERRPSRCPR